MKFFEYVNLLAMAELNATMPAQFYHMYAKQEKKSKR